MKTKVFVLTHIVPDWEIPWDSVYEPLYLHAYDRAERPYPLTDCSGEHSISNLNFYYSEFTGTYTIWKGLVAGWWPWAEYIGQCQYRRLLPYAGEAEMLDGLKNAACICGVTDCQTSVAEHFMLCHFQKVYDLARGAVATMYPECLEAFDSAMGQRYMTFSAGMLMKRDAYVGYAKFMFDIAEYVRVNLGMHTRDDAYAVAKQLIHARLENDPEYLGLWHSKNEENEIKFQMGIGGFLAERLLTVYLAYKKMSVYPVRYKTFGDLNVHARL